MKISKQNFHSWKVDPVTKEVTQAISAVLEYVDNSLKDETVLLGDQKNIARLLGIKEGLNVFLGLTAQELVGEEENED